MGKSIKLKTKPLQRDNETRLRQKFQLQQVPLYKNRKKFIKSKDTTTIDDKKKKNKKKKSIMNYFKLHT